MGEAERAGDAMADVFRVSMDKPGLIGDRHYKRGEVVEVDGWLARDIVARGDGHIEGVAVADGEKTAVDPSHAKASKASKATRRRAKPAGEAGEDD